jgi:hypothetical protein
MTTDDPTDETEGLDTGSDAGTPGERAPVAPGDALSAAVEDDAPLPNGTIPVTDDAGRTSAVGDAGNPPDDGLTPTFREAPD